MKKNILLVLAVMILVRCGYLDDYSQDMGSLCLEGV